MSILQRKNTSHFRDGSVSLYSAKCFFTTLWRFEVFLRKGTNVLLSFLSTHRIENPDLHLPAVCHAPFITHCEAETSGVSSGPAQKLLEVEGGALLGQDAVFPSSGAERLLNASICGDIPADGARSPHVARAPAQRCPRPATPAASGTLRPSSSHLKGAKRNRCHCF